jgi:hypothetical protein
MRWAAIETTGDGVAAIEMAAAFSMFVFLGSALVRIDAGHRRNRPTTP